jgi:hypothetical protein
MKARIKKEHPETFMLRRSTKASSTKNQSNSHNATPRDQGGQSLEGVEHVYEVNGVAEAFAEAGYTLVSDSADDSWEPLNEVKVVQYFHSFILKRCCACS